MSTKQIYKYNTVAPSVMSNYADLIRMMLFNVREGNNDRYSFYVDRDTGFFSYREIVSPANAAATPQTEAEANAAVMEGLKILSERVTNARRVNSKLPSEITGLFNREVMRLRSVVPIYTNNRLTTWNALFGIELTSIPSTGFGERNKKAAVDKNSIALELTGKTISAVAHNYLPIEQPSKAQPIDLPNEPEIIYLPVNLKILAPFYLTANGLIPACNECSPNDKPSYEYSSAGPPDLFIRSFAFGSIAESTGTNTITIAAAFIVIFGTSATNGFSRKKIDQIKELETLLNARRLKLEFDIDHFGTNLNGFEIKFAFDIIEVNTNEEAKNAALTASEFDVESGGVRYSRKIQRVIIRNYHPNDFKNLEGVKQTASRFGSTVDKIGGITNANHTLIAMQEGVIAAQSYGGAFQSNVLHEMFHTFGFDKDGAFLGIGSAKTIYPTPEDIRDLIEVAIEGMRLIVSQSLTVHKPKP